MNNLKLTKKERLCSTKLIGKLFDLGESFFCFPLKVVYLETSLWENHPAQVGFTVSKRNFKHAVQRNLLKRRMREAYRLNKPGFYGVIPSDKQVALMFIYTAREEKDYQLIEKSMQKALGKLGELLQ